MKNRLFLFALMALLPIVAMAQDEKFQQAFDLVTEGVELYDNEKYNEAVKKFNESIKLYDHYASAYYEKALALIALEKTKDAKKSLETSIKKCEETEAMAMNYKFLADIVDEEGNPHKAVEYYEKAIELVDNDDPRILHSISYNYGVTLQKLATMEPDKKEEYSNKALNYFTFSLINNPTHAGSYYGFYSTLENDHVGFSYILGMLGWYGFFGGNHPLIGKLEEMPDKWLDINLTQEELDEFGPLTRLSYESVRESAQKEPSEYGKFYDMLMYAVPKVAEGFTDEPVPLNLLKDDIHNEFLWPLYAKMIREGVFETFCHAVAMKVKKDYIANANWMTKNDEAKQKLVDMLNNGRYFDNNLKAEETNGMVPSVDNVSSAEDAHARNEEARLACKYYINHYVGTEEMQKTTQFIFSWAQASPDVTIPIGEAEGKWLTEETTPYLIAYMSTCSLIQLDNKKKELTEEDYLSAVSTTLWYYDNNKDRTGTNAELDRLLNLAENDPDAFNHEVSENYNKLNTNK